ncbi:MAG TPA: hypothetical protein VGJ15_01615 [Pirellulales bacterium]
MPFGPATFAARSLAWVLAIVLAAPIGAPVCCGNCQSGSSTAVSSNSSDAGHTASTDHTADVAKTESGCTAGCCHQGTVKSCCAGKAMANRSCCQKPDAKQTGPGVGCLCACKGTVPANRPANQSATTPVDIGFATIAWVTPIDLSAAGSRTNFALSASETAADIPHRILHCSWIV